MNAIVRFPNRIPATEFEERRFKVYTDRQLDKIEAIRQLPADTLFEMKVVASVLPFRVNEYVINELINWEQVPDDPIYQLVFPQRGMLKDKKSTRLNSSHVRISYAVFCLKKKNKQNTKRTTNQY